METLTAPCDIPVQETRQDKHKTTQKHGTGSQVH